MQLFRLHAEARRSHWEAPWLVVGVWVDGQSFWPAYAGAEAASVRERQAGNAALVELPAVIAHDVARAGELGLAVAREGGGWDDEAFAAAPSA